MVDHFIVYDEEIAIEGMVGHFGARMRVHPILVNLEHSLQRLRCAFEEIRVLDDVMSRALPQLPVCLAVKIPQIQTAVGVAEAFGSDVFVEDLDCFCKVCVRIRGFVGRAVDSVAPCVVSLATSPETQELVTPTLGELVVVAADLASDRMYEVGWWGIGQIALLSHIVGISDFDSCRFTGESSI